MTVALPDVFESELCRREMLLRAGAGFGALPLSWLLRSSLIAAAGGTASFKLCAKHWKLGDSVLLRIAVINFVNHICFKFLVPAAPRFAEPGPPS